MGKVLINFVAHKPLALLVFTSSESWTYFVDNDLNITYGICVTVPKEGMRSLEIIFS